jgi:hypothetical protein
MSTNMQLSDATIEAALARCAERISGDGLHDEIMAGVARTSQSRPPLAARLGWLAWPAPSLRLVWVVAIAGLLLALLGGSLLVGSQQQRRLPAVVLPVGQLFQCPPGSTPDEPGPADQARPDMGAAVAFDRHAGRLVAVGVTNSMRPTVETWTFDVCTNTWTRMHPNREPPLFDTDQLVYDADSDVTIGILFGKVWAYDLQADTWTEKGSAWLSAACCAELLAYDPLSGLVVAADDEELLNYDVESDTWTPIHQANGPADWGMHAYDASVDRIIVYTFGGDEGLEPETWLLDFRTGRWSRSGAETPDVPTGMGTWAAIAYDEAAERTVVISSDQVAAYDATRDRWEILADVDPVEEWWPHDRVYDPVNRRLVGGLGGGSTVVAFDLATREWTVLLEPSVPSGPSSE